VCWGHKVAFQATGAWRERGEEGEGREKLPPLLPWWQKEREESPMSDECHFYGIGTSNWKIGTVTISFVYDKYYPIID